MVLVVPEQSQRPYRFGMTLLCVGALFNWLGLADSYSEPVPAIRYIGVGLIAAGASLICMAMCFWMRTIHEPATCFNNAAGNCNSTDPAHVAPVDCVIEKPPDYSTVVDVPPCYEDAIKLNPSLLILHSDNKRGQSQSATYNDTYSITMNTKCGNNLHVDTADISPKSSQLLAKVLRKSIRDIRKQLRNNETGSPKFSNNNINNNNCISSISNHSHNNSNNNNNNNNNNNDDDDVNNADSSNNSNNINNSSS